jgi:hypothetical protein
MSTSRQDKLVESYSALDMCEVIGTRQHTDKVDVLSVPMEPSEQQLLDDIILERRRQGDSPALRERARNFLVLYCEREQYSLPVLTKGERKRIQELLAEQPAAPVSLRQPRSLRRSTSTSRLGFFGLRWPAGLAVTALVVVSAVIGHNIYEASRQGGPPPGVALQHPPALQVPVGTTDLQNLKANYGPFTQLTPSDERPQTGQPALLLLEAGGTFVSQSWTVSSTASGWSEDIAGNVNNVDVKGDHADITNPDGALYIVGINQPFVFSGNPGTVLLVDPTGVVKSMSAAQATAVRSHLSR